MRKKGERGFYVASPSLVPLQSLSVRFGPKKIVYYPAAIHMQNTALQHMINQTIVTETNKLIAKQLQDAPSAVEELIGTFELKNNQRDVLSLTLTNYVYFQHAAHGMTYIEPLTFDLKKGTKCQLKDLFKKGSNYQKVLTNIVQQQIVNRGVPVLEKLEIIDDNQYFYIADKTLVLFFQLYDLTPYYYGFPMFPISVYDIENIIAEDSPLARMLENN